MMISLAALADEIAEQHDSKPPRSEVLTVITTYAADLGVPDTGAGWSCPHVQVGESNADIIRHAYAVGIGVAE